MSKDTVKIQIDLAANPEAAKRLESAFRKLGASGSKSGKSTAHGWKSADKQMAHSAKLVDSLKGALLALGAGLALRAVFSAVGEQEQELAKLDSSIKSTANAAGFAREKYLQMADAIQANTIYSNDAAVGIEGLLLTFKKIRGPQFRETLGLIADMSAKLGTDLQTNAIQAGKAINDPIYGVAQLTRVGVTFTDKQKAVIKALVDTGHAAKAQEIIIGELQSEFGGSAAAAANTFSGSIDQLKNAFGDLMKGNGEGTEGAKRSIQNLVKQIEDPRTQAAFASMVSGILSVVAALTTGITKTTNFAAAIGRLYARTDSGISDVNDAVKTSREYLAAYEKQLKEVQASRDSFFSKIKYKHDVAFGGKLVLGRYEWGRGKADKSLKAYEHYMLYLVKSARDGLASAVAAANKTPIKVAAPSIKVEPKGGGLDSTATLAAKAKKQAKQLQSAWASLTRQVQGLASAVGGPGAKAWYTYRDAITKAGLAAGKVIAAGGNVAAAQAEVETAMQVAAIARDRSLTAAAVQQGAAQKQVLAWIESTRAELAGPAAQALEGFKNKVAELRKLMDAGSITPTIFKAGVGAATAKMLASTKSTSTQVSEYWKQAAHNSEDALAQFLFDPFKDGLRGMVSQMADTLRRMAANMLASEAFKALASWGLKAGGWAGTAAKIFSASAKGNVFDAGRLQAFAAGGVIGSPTLFPVRGGRMGLMGEAGPEAIMPLLRSASGHLGVRASAPPVSLRIVNNLDPATIADAMTGSAGEQVILNTISRNSHAIRQELGK